MKISKTSSDQELTTLIKNGDVDAYEMLFRRYYERVYRFISIVIGSEQAAKDLAQDVFVRIWLYRDRLDAGKNLKNLIFVMSRNAALNHLNSKSCSSLPLESISEEDHQESKQADDNTIYHEMSARILDAVSSLPEKRRQVFRMSRFEHKPNEEIAREMGISVRTVEKHIELALKQIRHTAN